MSTAIKLRGDSTANWTSNNPVLADREVGVDTTLNQIKIGNGTSTWTQLSFATPKLTNPANGEGNYASASATTAALAGKAPIVNITGGANNYAPLVSPRFTNSSTQGNFAVQSTEDSLNIFEISGANGNITLNDELGDTLAKTQASTDSSTKLATTAFVQAQKASPTFTGTVSLIGDLGDNSNSIYITSDGDGIFLVSKTGDVKINQDKGKLIISSLSVFADNTAAAALASGTVYRTSSGVLMIKY